MYEGEKHENFSECFTYGLEKTKKKKKKKKKNYLELFFNNLAISYK